VKTDFLNKTNDVWFRDGRGNEPNNIDNIEVLVALKFDRVGNIGMADVSFELNAGILCEVRIYKKIVCQLNCY
jgi:hypothetical protein